MKLTREELQRGSNESPFKLFQQGIRADATRDKYTRTLQRILVDILGEFLEGSVEDRAAQLVRFAKQDPDYAQDLLLGLSRKLRERTLLQKSDKNYFNPQSFDNYFKPIKKLFDMNNVAFAWKRIYSTFPELNNISDTREWKLTEIQQMLKFANGSMDRAIILVAASSGIRSGAYKFHWEDVVPIFKIDGELKIDVTESQSNAEIVCAMLKVYRGTSESYPAFITPEAYYSILDYKIEWTKEVGRDPISKDPIFKRDGSLPVMANPPALKKRIERILLASGIRTPMKTGQKRHEVPVMNGFRRFWNKSCKEALSRDSPLASLIKKEFMMGHTGLVKFDRNYFKTQVLELAEEYLNAIPNLTISDEERTKIENRKLRKERSDLQSANEEKDKLLENYKKLEARTKRLEKITLSINPST